MRRFNRWLATAPLYVYFLVVTVTFGVTVFFLDLAIGHRTDWGWLVGAPLYGLLMTLFVARQRRRSGGAQRQLAFARAAKSGELPPEADPAEWAPLLERKKRMYRRLQPLGAIEFAAFTALAVWLALSQGRVWWLFAAFFVALGVIMVVSSHRYVGRIERMQRQLGTASPSDPIEP